MIDIVTSRFDLTASRHPNKPAFIFYSPRANRWDTVTFEQLLDSTQRLTRGLLACRVTPGMHAALMTLPSPEFFALAFALLKLGIVPIIVDPAIGLGKATECLNEAEPDIFIGNAVTHFLRRIYGWGKDTIQLNTSISSLLRITHYESYPSLSSSFFPESPAAIIYTSGSTGLPKGALYTHANFTAQLDMLQETFNIAQDEVDLPAFPLYALIDALMGVTSVIPDITFPVPKNINPARTLSAIQKYKVTNTFASPIVLDKLAEYGVKHNIKLPSLKRVITAGAPAPIHVQEKFRELLSADAHLFGIYGATETLPIAIVESREIFDNARHQSAQGAGVCLGKPVNGVNVRIIRISDTPIENWDNALELPANQVGEITVKGKAVTESYIGREEATRLAKIKEDGGTVHRMGDVGYFDEQGRLWYCGRKSHRVITKDDVLFTEQIEGIFNAHPHVYRTALVGMEKEPVLWIELEQNTHKTGRDKIKQELVELAKNHVQASKIKRFLFSNKFPTDVRHNSKIIREQLAVLAKRPV